MDQYTVDPQSPVPPFEQLRAQVVARVDSGGLAPGDRLPTVRSLAADLGLAVNTVAKAYRALEAEGVVVTEGRRGTFVPFRSGPDSADAAEAAAQFVAAARRLGLTRDEATALVERAW